MALKIHNFSSSVSNTDESESGSDLSKLPTDHGTDIESIANAEPRDSSPESWHQGTKEPLVAYCSGTTDILVNPRFPRRRFDDP